MKTNNRVGTLLSEAGCFSLEAPTDVLLNNSRARLRVLLVEDSLLVRQRMRSLIEESGLVEIVGETGSVGGALVLFHTRGPDAVVLDLNLADGDGCAVLTEIKRTRPACVVMVLTNFVIPECRAFCLKLGADHFFNKSTEFERVVEVLGDLRRGPVQSDNGLRFDPASTKDGTRS